MKKALILGCSHAAGSELSSAGSFDEYGQRHSFAGQIASKLNLEFDNQAIPGGSNDAMFRIWEAYDSPVDLIIAVWSGWTRTEIFYNKQWPQFCAGGFNNVPELDEYVRQWTLFQATESWGRTNKIKNILALNALAKSKNISVINVDAFWPVANYAWPDYVYWPVPENFWDWAKQGNYSATSWGHFDLQAHTDFAEYVFESLQKQKFSV